MTAIVQGSIPFPPMTNPATVLSGATALQHGVAALALSQAGITAVNQLTQGNWTGSAQQATGNQLTQRIEHVVEIIAAMELGAAVLTTLAAAITAAETAYSAAVVQERAAEAGLPWTAAALAAALAEEGAAVAALEAAGGVAAAELAGIAATLEALDFGGMADLGSIGGAMISYGLNAGGVLASNSIVSKAIAPTLAGAITGGANGALQGGLTSMISTEAGALMSGKPVPFAAPPAPTVTATPAAGTAAAAGNTATSAAATAAAEAVPVSALTPAAPLTTATPAPATATEAAPVAATTTTIAGGDGLAGSLAWSTGANGTCAVTAGVGVGEGAQGSVAAGTLPEPGLSLAGNGSTGGLDLDGSLKLTGPGAGTLEGTVAVPAPIAGPEGAAIQAAAPVGVTQGITGSLSPTGAVNVTPGPTSLNVGEFASGQLKGTIQFPCPKL